MLQMMLRPRWIAALLLTLVIAGVFAGLAQWQIGAAATSAISRERPTEAIQPLALLIAPGEATPQSVTGQRVSVTGAFQPGDTVVVPNRVRNIGDSTPGWWLVGHFVTVDEVDLPVVVGWAASEEQASSARSAFDDAVVGGNAPSTVAGRFLPSDAPAVPSGNSQEITAVSVGHLINVWQSVAPAGAYFGYVISEQPGPGLDAVSTPAPDQQVQLNWLNVFYALEWIVFAGFAVYFWWRLVRDAVEREREAAAESAAG